VRRRSQLETETAGEARWSERGKSSGRFMEQEKSASATPFNGVREEGPLSCSDNPALFFARRLALSSRIAVLAEVCFRAG
jgi:hypothetical protein